MTLRQAALIAVATTVLIACTPASISPSSQPSSSSTPGSSASPAPSTGPSVSPAASRGPITSAQEAAAAVLASDPRFTGIGPTDPNVIGACCFYEVASAPDGWTVTIEIGWDDCPAGCIERHRWTYSVTRDGEIALQTETGPEPPPDATGGGTGGIEDVPGIGGTATAGPTCPVVKPDDPSCADRPVVGATIHILDDTGTEVAQLETDAAGGFTVTLPPGRYRVIADAVDGLMGGAPSPIDIEVGAHLARVQIQYDTGIR